MTLTVSYASASDFVSEYGGNLAAGGVFVPGATFVDLLREVDLDIVLPGSVTLRVRAKPVFVLDEASARAAGMAAGTGMEITAKPSGFDDSLRRHLFKLSKRRDVAIMVGDIPGAAKLSEAGFKLIPLESLAGLNAGLADALVPVIAIVVPPEHAAAYSMVVRTGGTLIAVHGVSRAADIDRVIANVDRLL